MKAPIRLRGFTLIELLIVVAIIAILAAIAVPNFLEAQTRARISRVHSDMRTLATGFELYYSDNQAYPPEYLNPPLGVPETVRILKAQSHLTTPIAYLSSIPYDTFRPEATGQYPVYWYYNWLERYGNMINPHALRGDCPWYDEEAAWMLTSLGPIQLPQYPMLYDPTNGTISEGNITRLGPGGGGSNR